MNTNLRKTVLDNRQFVGLLLLACSIASFVIVMIVTAHPPDDSLESMTAQWQAEVSTVERFGFLFPPLQAFIAPLLTGHGATRRSLPLGLTEAEISVMHKFEVSTAP